jgi:hypothetical protein
MTASETLLPDERPSITLSNGMVVTTTPMRTRSLLRLLKILTRGVFWAIPQLMKAEKETVVEEVLGALIIAIPEAEDATIDFVKSVVTLPGKAEAKDRAGLDLHLDDPPLDDLLLIVEQVVEHEAEDLTALGNRLTGMLKLAERANQVPATAEPTTEPQTTGSPLS